MSKTNTLTSHHPESKSHRVDKMSINKRGFKILKKFFNKKRRQLLKQNLEGKI
jgi:hypothetical protein